MLDNLQQYMYSEKYDKHFIVPCEIYPFDIFCFFGENEELLNGTLKKYLDIDAITQQEYDKIISYDLINSNEGCFIMNKETNLSILYIKKVPDDIQSLAVLNHEIFHATTEILEKVGIFYSHETSEAFAYFLQYLTEYIYSGIQLSITTVSEIEELTDIPEHNSK